MFINAGSFEIQAKKGSEQATVSLRRFYLNFRSYRYVLFVIILVSASKSQVGGSHLLVKNSLRDVGLTVVDPSSPDFRAEIEKLLSPDAMAKASPFLPWSLVVVNNTGQYVWGFTVVYTYPDWISPAGTPWKHRISPSGAGPSNRSRMLAPGSRFLITPVSDFLASRDADENRLLQPFIDEGMDRMIERFQAQHPKSNERVEVSVDSVIFEDGVLQGPDSEGMMHKVNERIRAEKDLAASVNKLRGEDLKAKLLFHSHKGMGDEYSGHTSSAAHAILDVLNNHGESAALEVVTTLRTTSWFSNSETVRRK